MRTSPPKYSTEHRFLLLCAAAAVAGLVAIGLLLDPDPRGYGTHEALGFSPCLPMELWNLPCPGCGVTTSVNHAVEGHLLESFRVQPFGFLLFAVAVVFVVTVFGAHFLGRDLGPVFRRTRWKPWVVTTALAMFLAWGYKIACIRGLLDLT